MTLHKAVFLLTLMLAVGFALLWLLAPPWA